MAETANKDTRTNAERFTVFHDRVKDVIANQSDSVRRNAINRVGMGIWSEFSFVCKLLREVTGGDVGKLNKVKVEDDFNLIPEGNPALG